MVRLKKTASRTLDFATNLRFPVRSVANCRSPPPPNLSPHHISPQYVRHGANISPTPRPFSASPMPINVIESAKAIKIQAAINGTLTSIIVRRRPNTSLSAPVTMQPSGWTAYEMLAVCNAQSEEIFGGHFDSFRSGCAAIVALIVAHCCTSLHNSFILRTYRHKRWPSERRRFNQRRFLLTQP